MSRDSIIKQQADWPTGVALALPMASSRGLLIRMKHARDEQRAAGFLTQLQYRCCSAEKKTQVYHTLQYTALS